MRPVTTVAPGQYAETVRRAFANVVGGLRQLGHDVWADRVEDAYDLWLQNGPSLDTPYAMDVHAIDAVILARAGVNGKLLTHLVGLAETHGPKVYAQLDTQLRLARAIALTMTLPGNQDRGDPQTGAILDLVAARLLSRGWSTTRADAHDLRLVIVTAADELATYGGEEIPYTWNMLRRLEASIYDASSQKSTTAVSTPQVQETPVWVKVAAVGIAITAAVVAARRIFGDSKW